MQPKQPEAHLKSHDGGDVMDKTGDGEQHVLGVPILLDRAVDLRPSRVFSKVAK